MREERVGMGQDFQCELLEWVWLRGWVQNREIRQVVNELPLVRHSSLHHLRVLLQLVIQVRFHSGLDGPNDVLYPKDAACHVACASEVAWAEPR